MSLTTEGERVSDSAVAVGNSEQVVVGKVATWRECAAEVLATCTAVVCGCLVGHRLFVLKAAVAVAVGVAVPVGAGAGIDSGSSVGGGRSSGHLVTVGDLRHDCDDVLVRMNVRWMVGKVVVVKQR